MLLMIKLQIGCDIYTTASGEEGEFASCGELSSSAAVAAVLDSLFDARGWEGVGSSSAS